MRLVFAHDHKLRKVNEKYYTTGGLSDEVLGKYLNFFDKLTVFCRCISKQEFDTNLFLLSNPNIEIMTYSKNGSLVPTIKVLKEMNNIIKESDGVIVKLHSVIGEIALHYAKKNHVPYLIELVGDPWDAYWNHGNLGKIVAPIMTALTKHEVKKADFVLYVTKEFLENRYPTNGRFKGISDVSIRSLSDNILEKRISKINNQKETLLKIGTIGQLDVKYKGQQYVFKALSTLKKNGLKIQYELVGTGSNSRLLKLARSLDIEKQIIFKGVLSHDKVFDWLDEIDLYIQPSKQEGLPRALVEAMSRACPAVGSNAGGITELLPEQCVFKKGSVNGIIDILKNVNKDTQRKNAKINFNKSHEYEEHLLSSARYKFYEDFFRKCKEKKDSIEK